MQGRAMIVDRVHRPPPSAPRLDRVGAGIPVVTLDAVTDDVDRVRAIAADLAPFPPATTLYPGVRRLIDSNDGAAWAYVQRMLNDVAPYMAGAFDCAGFDLVEASFSIVTTPPALLAAPQRAPHFDGTDPDLVALLHYLGDKPGSGTAFFRHRATAIERVTDDNLARYLAAARHEAATGYIQGTDAYHDELHRVDATADRVIIYPGSLLHSGIIPPAMPLDPDPRKGRLTANYFVRLTR